MLPEYAKWSTFKKQIESNTFPMLGDLKDEYGNELEESYKDSQTLLQYFFKKDKEYEVNQKALTSLVHRIALLNSFYSTRMGQDWCFKVAQRINQCDNISYRLFCKDVKTKIELVKELADKIYYKPRQAENDKLMFFRPYSFITKYCAIYTWAEGECLYPIYDSLVLEVLRKEFNREGEYLNPYIDELENKFEKSNLMYNGKITINRIKDLDNYEHFYNIMDFLRDKYNTDFRKLDIFMWRRGQQLIKNTPPKLW